MFLSITGIGVKRKTQAIASQYVVGERIEERKAGKPGHKQKHNAANKEDKKNKFKRLYGILSPF